MEKVDYTLISSKFFYRIKIRANFLSGGRYKIGYHSFGGFMAKDHASLRYYIENNKESFTVLIKSKRRDNKLLIRKSDNLDFVSDIDVYRENFSDFIVRVASDKIYFTDYGQISVVDWIKINPEYII